MLSDEDLLKGFLDDAKENMGEIEPALLQLEKSPEDPDLVNQLFRSVHSLKGGAGFFGLSKIGSLSHAMETLLSGARNGSIQLETPHIDALLAGFDKLGQMIDDVAGSEEMDIEDELAILLALTEGGEVPKKESPKPEAKPEPPPATAAPEPKPTTEAVPKPPRTTVKPPKPDSVAPKEISTETSKSSSSKPLVTTKSDENIRVSVGRLNQLVDLAGELVLVRNQIMRHAEPMIKTVPVLNEILLNFNMVTTELQEKIMNTRMQPIAVVFNKFPRVVRELAHKLGKEIELVTEGNDVELDKTIIETLGDPLTHIVRNTADHGIEPAAERLKKNKPAKGTLLMKAYHESGQVIIQVSDDGKGIHPDVMAAKAVEKGLIDQETADRMSNKEKIQLILRPGFSTAEAVSAVSGRGVGMDVVRSNIEAIGGRLDIHSEINAGTTLLMTLPLTMAIVSCLIVQSEGYRFAFPQVNMEELVVVKQEQTDNMLGKVQGQDVLRLRGTLLPLITLAEGLGIVSKSGTTKKFKDNEMNHILIVKVGGNRIGIAVDAILDIEEIVVKPMPEYLGNLTTYSGTTILGDGTIAMIIDVIGFTTKNSLLLSEKINEDHLTEEIQDKAEEEQSLLIFDNGTDEQYAITMSLIQRVDTIDTIKIQHIGDKEYIEYRGEQLRLLRLENYLPVQKPKVNDGVKSVIIPKQARIPVGILIHQVIDTKSIGIRMERGSIHETGVLGSTLIDGRITLLLDLYAILEHGEPKSVSWNRTSDKTKNKEILLVEDTPFFQTLVSDYLTSAGFKVTLATQGQEALEHLYKHEFDIVLTDIEMPIMDGRDLIKNIRNNPKWNALPVLALTSLSDPDIIARDKAGFNEWLVKLDKDTLLNNLVAYI